MKDTKRRLEWFSFYDHTGLEAHLERMAGRGWLLEKIGNFTWHYRRIEPKQVAFSVCYFPRASAFDPGPSEEQEMFYDFCRHTGWTLAAASAQMQVFYNERENPVPIDTDPALEVEAIHRSAKKSFLVSQALLAAVAVMNIAVQLCQLHTNPIMALSNPAILFLAVCWPALLLTIGVDVGTYFLWRRRALKAAGEGEFLPTRSHPVFQKILLAVVIAAFLWWLSALAGSQSPTTAVLIGALVAVYTIIICLITNVRELLKRKKASARTNRAVTIAACVGLSLLLAAAVPFFAITVLGYDRDAREARPDDPVLTVEELLDTGAAAYSFWDSVSQSPLLARFEAHQSPWRHEDMASGAPGLRYTVVVVKAGFLYGLCREELLHQYDRYDRHYSPISAAPWGAVEAYQAAYEGEGPMTDFLLCYPDRIVYFDPDWEPTPAQMALVGEKLGGQ